MVRKWEEVHSPDENQATKDRSIVRSTTRQPVLLLCRIQGSDRKPSLERRLYYKQPDSLRFPDPSMVEELGF